MRFEGYAVVSMPTMPFRLRSIRPVVEDVMQRWSQSSTHEGAHSQE